MLLGELKYPFYAALLVGVVALPGLAYGDDSPQSELMEQPIVEQVVALEDEAGSPDQSPVIQADGSDAGQSIEKGQSRDDGDGLIAPSAEASSVKEDSTEEKKAEAEDSSEQIPDGTYAIESSAADGKVVDAKDGSTSSGTRVQSYESNKTDAQVWRLNTSSAGVTTIYHAASGKVLDVANGEAYEGAIVQLWESNGTNAQKWRLVRDGDTYKIVSLLDESYVLDLSGAGKANGTPIQLWRDNGTLAQRWRFAEAETVRQRANRLAAENSGVIADGTYAFSTLLSGAKVIDVPNADYFSGNALWLYSSNGTDAQVWSVMHDSAGYLTITNTVSGKALDVRDGNASQGALVQLWAGNGTWAQKWIAVSTSKGFKLLSALNTALALDVKSASTANKTPLQLWADNGTLAQRWSVKEASTARMRLDKLAADNKGLVKDGNYALRSDLLLTLVLDARGGGTSDGTVVQTYTANDTYAQWWNISHDSKGYLTLINTKSGKALDVANGKAFNGAAVQLYTPNGTWAQKWIAVLRDGSYVLVSGINENYVLDVASASKVNSTAVQLYASNGTAAQGWLFTKAGKEGVSFSAAAGGNSIIPINIGFGDYAVALPSYAGVQDTYIAFGQDVALGENAYAVSKDTAASLPDAQIMSLESAVELSVSDLQGLLLSKVWFLKSSGVTAVFLSSDDPVSHGRKWVESSADHSNSATGTASVVAADGTSIYEGKLNQIKGRGNTSWDLAKKPYQIKLDKKADLVRTGNAENKSKTWLLISDGYDSSALRNVIAYSYAQLLGVSKAIDFDIVDLYYDGEYRGTYLLCEKVQIAKGRVDIEDLEEKNEDLNPGIDDATIVDGVNSYGMEIRYAQSIANPSNITGGYLIEHEVSWERYTTESAYFAVMIGGELQHFVCKSPEIWSYEEADYMSCLLQDVFDAAANDGIVPTWRGSSRAGMKLSDFIDVDSFARAYWVNEILKNPDGYVWSSGYLFKDIDSNGSSKIAFGPVWDFDLSCGNETNGDWGNPVLESTGWYTRNAALVSSLMKSQDIENAVANTKSAAISGLRAFLNGGSFDTTADRVTASLEMNELVWGGRDEDRNDVRDWLNNRLDWVANN